jgi:thiamine biosynthesis lipoprotein
MGTSVAIRIYAPTSPQANAARTALELAFAELARIEQLMSHWLPTSDVGRLNAAAGGATPVSVSADTLAVLVEAQRMSRLSRGAFDITVGAFQGVWRFDHDRDGSIPSAARIAEQRRLVGWRDVELDVPRGTARLRRAGMRITLGGIAKGYGVDRATEVLRRAGMTQFMVQAGGDLRVSGCRGPRPWQVGIQDPRGSRPFAAAGLCDRTFSTSGDYERFVIVQGKRYHHILDPRTGMPAAACRSVTVAAPTAILAEGVSKAVFVLGPERGLALCRRLGVDAAVVDAAGTLHVTPWLRARLRLLAPLAQEASPAP